MIRSPLKIFTMHEFKKCPFYSHFAVRFDLANNPAIAGGIFFGEVESCLALAPLCRKTLP